MHPSNTADLRGEKHRGAMMSAMSDAKRPPHGAAAYRLNVSFAYGSMMGPSYAPLRSFSSVERAEARFAYP